MSVRWFGFILPLMMLAAGQALAVPALPSKEGAQGFHTEERVLSGTMSRADYETYREVPFDVPKGVTRITVQFSYDGKEDHSVIDLGVMDPDRFRGWGGGSHPEFTLAAEDATPGFLPGPLPAGRWKLLLGVPNIRPGAIAHYEARITLETGAKPVDFSDKPLRADAGWYRGDLHSHTGNSDGRCPNQSGKKVPCPAYRTIDAAVARGLDFIAITDHNTTAHYEAMRALQPAYDKILLVPGREITTFWGHANVFGPTSFLDFRMSSPDTRSAHWLTEAKAAGAVVSINHPSSPSGEVCMGCGWQMTHVPAGNVQAIEVVNGGTWSQTGSAEGPLQGIAYWQQRLNAGERLTAIGGSDNHDASRPSNVVGSVGSPTTVIYMRHLSVDGLLDGVRAGRVFVDMDGKPDRMLDMRGRVGAQNAFMGEVLNVPKGEVARFDVTVAGVPGGRLSIIMDGKILPGPFQTPSKESTDSPYVITWAGDGAKHWIRADVRDEGGRLLLLGNPIYIRP